MTPPNPRPVGIRGYYKEEREKKRHKELLETNLAILKELKVTNTRARASDPSIPKCPVCDGPIEGRVDKVYCSDAHRKATSRARRRKTRHG